jgi:HAD superfamily hydrolase (TIGR01509 family)
MDAVIFDMDGVLVENSAVHDETWKMICKKYGKPKTSEEIHSIFGGTNDVFVEKLLEITDNVKIKEIALEKESLYREIYDKQIKTPEGLLELLFDLKRNNIRLAVGTSAPRVNLDFVLDKLDIRGFFDVLVDESFVSHGKPDPEIYQVVSKKLGIDPSRCIVIEDSIFGLQAALAAGMKTIAITTTFSAEKLQIADKIISSFKELSAESIVELNKTFSR